VNAAGNDTLLIAGTDIIKESNKTIKLGNGYAKYDSSTKTLELNNASIDCGSGSGITGDISGSLTIKVTGTNTITSNYQSALNAYGIFVNTPLLNIIGTDSKTSSLNFIKNGHTHQNYLFFYGITSTTDLNIENINLDFKFGGYLAEFEFEGIVSKGNKFNMNNSNLNFNYADICILIDNSDTYFNNSRFTCDEVTWFIKPTNRSTSTLTLYECNVDAVNFIKRHGSNAGYLITPTGSGSGKLRFDLNIIKTKIKATDDTLFVGLLANKLNVKDSIIDIVSGIHAVAGYDFVINGSTMNVQVKNDYAVSLTAYESLEIIDSNLTSIALSDKGQAISVAANPKDPNAINFKLDSNLAIKEDLKFVKDSTHFTLIPNSDNAFNGSNAAKKLTIYTKDADYSGVDAALNSIPKDLSIYTPASVKDLNDAKNAVVRSKKSTEQQTVDNYAKAINLAIKNLATLPSKVDGTKPNPPKTSTSTNSLAIISLVLVSGLGLIKVIKRKEVE
ncbi:MAG: LPXTG cell wall anchor domain-containing protein, partial [Erysipelotrichaceae bacterium]